MPLRGRTWRRQLRGSNGSFLCGSYGFSVSGNSTVQNLGQFSSSSTRPENPKSGISYGSQVEQANCQRGPKWGKTPLAPRRLAGVARRDIQWQQDFSLKLSCSVSNGTARTLLLQ